MRNTWAVCKREFASYFSTPVGYAAAGIFSALAGLGFAVYFIDYATLSQSPRLYGFTTAPDFEETMLSPYLVFCGQMIMFLSPLLTMRLLAEERHRGTIELLLTYPLRDREVIFGKYLAALGMVAVLLLFVGVQVGLVGHYARVEPAVLVMGVVTVFLMGAAFSSLGLFVSSITRNQVTSGTLAFGLCLLLYFVGIMGEFLPKANPTPTAWPALARAVAGVAYGLFRGFIVELDLDAHAKQMAQGVVRPTDLVYYPLFSIFFLFLTFRALESRNWRSSS